MSAYVRFHRGLYVDAIIPSAVGIAPDTAPGDIVWTLQNDVNPAKVIEVTENVQATDPITNEPAVDANGNPVWETQNALDASGNPIQLLDPITNEPAVDENGQPVYKQEIVTAQAQKTIYLLNSPNNFTQEDFTGYSYVVTGSLEEAQQKQIALLDTAFNAALVKGFSSSADGTSRTYTLDPLAYSRINGYLSIINSGKGNAQEPWLDVTGFQTSFTPTTFITFATDAFAFYGERYAHLGAQKAAVLAATTPADVQKITY